MKRHPDIGATSLIIFSALLNWLAQPNELFNQGTIVCGLVSYVPIYLAFRKNIHTARQSIKLGLLYAVISTISSYFWLSNFGEYSLWTIGGVILVYLVFYGTFFRLLFHLASVKPPEQVFPFAFVLAWVSFEFFKSRGYLAFPWNLAAFPFHRINVFNQIADVAGVWIISAAVFMLQAWGAEYYLKRTSHSRNGLVMSLAVIVAFFGYGTIRLAQFSFADSSASEDSREITALLIQQNVDSWAADDPAEGMRTAIALSRKGMEESLKKYGKKPDIISWSETSLRYPYETSPGPEYYRSEPSEYPFSRFLNDTGTGLVTGAPIILNLDPPSSMNGVLHIARNGTVQFRYGKIHLVPFAEHLPFSDIPVVATFLREVIGLPSRGWTAGRTISLLYFEESGLYAGTPICFEDSFSNLTRQFVREGADILLNLTNNSWSKTKSAQLQHLISSKYRSIENRRPLLRATNSGVTSIIDRRGRMVEEIPMFNSNYLLGKLKVASDAGLTIYSRFGDWFAWTMVSGLLAVLIVHNITTKKRPPRRR